jgi:uncharacterized protein (TIGR03000 family)
LFLGGGYLGGGYLGGDYYGDSGYNLLSQGYGYAPNYYGAAPGYAPTTQVRQSYYPAGVQDFANLTVIVPVTDAQVWFDNTATTQQGMQRLFASPPLTPNQNFTYTIKARWMENGKAVNQERQVNVQAGQNVTVNFREAPRESVSSPIPAAILRK